MEIPSIRVKAFDAFGPSERARASKQEQLYANNINIINDINNRGAGCVKLSYIAVYL